MLDGKLVGCGITTFNRPEQLRRLCQTLPMDVIDFLVIVNDGAPYESGLPEGNYHFVQNECNLGVAKSKNKALDYLLDHAVDHIFLIEDDIYIRDSAVFSRYAQVSNQTGIQHLNFSQHGVMNKTADGKPNPRVSISYSDVLSVPFYPHCVGAFSYYSRQCLVDVGLMDEGFFNAFEHVEHTLRIIQAGQHPQFWFFADIPDSWIYLGDDAWSMQQSTISSKSDHQLVAQRALVYFHEKHGVMPADIPLVTSDEFVATIQDIYGRYANSSVTERCADTSQQGMALAHKYCVGQGVELGAAAHNAFHLPNCLNVAPSDGVDYIHPRDLADFLKYKNAQVEQAGGAVSVDLVGDFQTIRSDDNSFDYIISSHVIEHVPNVFGAYLESQRVLKNLGVFFCIFPKRIAAATDGVRALSTLEQMIEAHEIGVGIEAMPGDLWREHYQVFSLQRMLEVINYLNNNGLGCWYIECIEETDSKVGNGHTVVLRKLEGLSALSIVDDDVFSKELQVLWQSGRLRDALFMLKVSLSFRFFDAARLHLAAYLSRELGDTVEAVEFLRQALVLDPENEGLRKEFFAWTGGFYVNPVL